MKRDAEAGCFVDPIHPAHPLRAVTLWRPTWCNCLIWAWWMRRQYGGYTLKRRAFARWRWWRGGKDRAAFFSHAMWSPDGETCFEFTRDKPDWHPWWVVIGLLLYRGEVRRVTRQWP